MSKLSIAFNLFMSFLLCWYITLYKKNKQLLRVVILTAGLGSLSQAAHWQAQHQDEGSHAACRSSQLDSDEKTQNTWNCGLLYKQADKAAGVCSLLTWVSSRPLDEPEFARKSCNLNSGSCSWTCHCLSSFWGFAMETKIYFNIY